MLAASLDGFFVLAACYELTLTLCFCYCSWQI